MHDFDALFFRLPSRLPTSILPSWGAILRWAILSKRIIRIAHLDYYSISMRLRSLGECCVIVCACINSRQKWCDDQLQTELQLKLYLPPKINFVLGPFCTFLGTLGGVCFFCTIFGTLQRIFFTIWHHFRHLRPNPLKNRNFEEVSLLHNW